MNRSKLLSSLAALGLLSGAAGAMAKATGPYAGQKLAAHAKVSMDKAEAIALAARPGTLADRELEKEKGGSGLRYSFDIKAADGAVWEVGVDARTGKVLENAKEGPHPD